MKTFLCLFLLIPFSSSASDWTRADSYRETAYLVVDAIDYLQTRNIAHNPDKWIEYNHAIGEHPNIAQVNRYFALTAIAHVGIAYALPKDWRAGFQYISIGTEFGWVRHNHSIGIMARF